MKTRAISKYNRISARKVRLVANTVRGEKATNAFHILSFTPKKAARLIEKTLKSAVANAENNFKADKKDLVVSEIMIDEGPSLKRYRPRSRGMAHSIMKRTSHVTIVVEGKEKEDKKEKKGNNKKIEKKLVKGDRSSRKVTSDHSKDKKNGS